MRVYLKAGGATMATTAPRDEPPRTNGRGGSHGANGEASAFRELLTEFRNLTERYGQALLALGEARGEVAGLRSRVDLLEARLDLRLPAGPDVASRPWEAPTVSAPTPEVPAPAEAEVPAAAPLRRAPRSPRPRKSRATRAAVAGFKQALERAQDPTVSDLADASSPGPGVDFPAAAIASAPAAVGEVFVASVPEPFELPAAPFEPGPTVAPEAPTEPEPEPELPSLTEAEVQPPESSSEPEEGQPVYSATVVEPDWFADGDFAWLDAADAEARLAPAVEPEAVAEAEASEPEPSEGADAEPEPEATGSFALPESYPEADWRGTAQQEPGAIDPGPPAAAERLVESHADDQPFEELQSAEPVATGGSVALAVEEEVMWIGSEPGSEMEILTTGAIDEQGPSFSEVTPLDTIVWPTTDPIPTVVPPEPPLLSLSEEELARLAHDEGWDEAEVAAIRAMIAPPPSGAAALPGSAELGDALAALRAVPVQDEQPEPVSQWTKPPIGSGAPTRSDDWAFEVESRPQLPQPQAPQRPAPFPSPAPGRPADDPNWLRRRQGPAATAYRRLRRLFPG